VPGFLRAVGGLAAAVRREWRASARLILSDVETSRLALTLPTVGVSGAKGVRIVLPIIADPL